MSVVVWYRLRVHWTSDVSTRVSWLTRGPLMTGVWGDGLLPCASWWGQWWERWGNYTPPYTDCVYTFIDCKALYQRHFALYLKVTHSPIHGLSLGLFPRKGSFDRPMPIFSQVATNKLIFFKWTQAGNFPFFCKWV